LVLDNTQLIIVELRMKLQNEKCLEKGDMHTHLAKLQQMLEDLALMGEVISDDNFCSIILGSLLISYDNFLMSLTNQLNLSLINIHIAKMTVGGATIPAHNIVVTLQKLAHGQEANQRAM
jgi:hypothetical protein